MKAKEVTKILNISQTTLWRYSKEGMIKRTKVGKHYDYDEESVYQLITKNSARKTDLDARVSIAKQKTALQSQIKLLQSWALDNGYQIHGLFSDVASGINFERRPNFFTLLAEIFDYKVERIIIAYKDRLSRVGFRFFEKSFQKFGTQVLIISEIGDPKLDSEDIFEEIISLLPCYSLKLYSKRTGKNSLEVGVSETKN
jgi:predicted site-specific integrase-resolvase